MPPSRSNLFSSHQVTFHFTVLLFTFTEYIYRVRVIAERSFLELDGIDPVEKLYSVDARDTPCICLSSLPANPKSNLTCMEK